MEHIEGRRKCISEYRMHSSSDSAEASFTLVILPKKGSEKEEETDPATDRYIVFATNIQEGRKLWNISRIAEDYRKRWVGDRNRVHRNRTAEPERRAGNIL